MVYGATGTSGKEHRFVACHTLSVGFHRISCLPGDEMTNGPNVTSGHPRGEAIISGYGLSPPRHLPPRGRFIARALSSLSLAPPVDGELGPGPEALESLLRFGGFPEPFFKGNTQWWRRWQRERLSRVVHEDLQDLERVREIGLIELLVEALPSRVGAPMRSRITRVPSMAMKSSSCAVWVRFYPKLIPPNSALTNTVLSPLSHDSRSKPVWPER